MKTSKDFSQRMEIIKAILAIIAILFFPVLFSSLLYYSPEDDLSNEHGAVFGAIFGIAVDCATAFVIIMFKIILD